MTFQRDPLKCVPGDTVERWHVADWPKMTDKSAVAFRKFTGTRLSPGTYLVRKGNHIFEVGDADLALCKYFHSRAF